VAARRQLINEGWDAGARSVGALLRGRGLRPPSDRTIHRVLVRAGMVEPAPTKRPRSSFKRFEHPSPNGMWQLDGTQWQLADDTAVTIIRLEDDHARKIMASLAAFNENSHDAWECMLTAMGRHGAPAAVLTDGGSAFTARRTRGGLSEFEALLRGHGITPIVSSPHHPQTCGKKEREWATLKRWLRARPPAADLAGLQHQLDAYDAFYNSVREHQGLHGQTPDQRYAATAKAAPAPDPLPPPMRCTNVKVNRHGVVMLGNRQRTSIGVEWAHTRVDVIRDNLEVVIIHRDKIIRTLRIDPNRQYQPSGRPASPTPRPPLLSDKS
jgi:transposase InsO family protein